MRRSRSPIHRRLQPAISSRIPRGLNDHGQGSCCFCPDARAESTKSDQNRHPEHKSFALALIGSALVHLSTGPVFAQGVRVPGTKVTLTPPDGFSLAQQYPGFEREVDQASIMVTELPGPAAEMIRVMTKEALAGRGMVLVASSNR